VCNLIGNSIVIISTMSHESLKFANIRSVDLRNVPRYSKCINATVLASCSNNFQN